MDYFIALISNVASKNNYTCQTIDLVTFTWIEERFAYQLFDYSLGSINEIFYLDSVGNFIHLESSASVWFTQ
jgi:hypothetical protein